MNKRFTLADIQHITDNNNIHLISRPRGHVIFKDPITGKVLFEKDNKVVISGSMLTACALFDIEPWVNLPSYNESLGLEYVANNIKRTAFADIPNDPLTSKKQKPNIWLFCCGIDGCGSENSEVYDVNYTNRIKPQSLIPFRYVVPGENTDLDDDERLRYFGRQVTSDHIAYYFKQIGTDIEDLDNVFTPHMRLLPKGGAPTEITDSSSIYIDTRTTQDAEVFVEMHLQITKEDFREYFIETTGSTATAHINSISLCSAWREMKDAHIVYQDITPVTQLNIPNESLVDQSKGIDITYQVFF